ncbi:MAG TPA: hypothetical protein PLV68_06945, partial [Ilumatobacteraceae bacterium]|nr:hypothetical protein [Ilumatobacteraceae bacterium]
ISDVDHLELHIITQRDRLRDVAAALTEMAERVPGGLGEIRRPLVSAVEPTANGRASESGGSDPVLDAIASSAAVSSVGHADDGDVGERDLGERDDDMGDWDAGEQDPDRSAQADDHGAEPLPFGDITAEVPRVDGDELR